MKSRRVTFFARAACLLVLTALVILPGCGDDEGDIVAPAISPNAASVSYTTSDSVTLKVDVEIGAVVEVAVADGLTAGIPVFVGTSALGDTWSFVVTGLQPGSNLIAATAQDKSGNQQTLFMTVVYNFLAIDRIFTPVMSGVAGYAGYQIMGTVADGGLPSVTVANSAGTVLSPVAVTKDPVFAKRWIATFDLPAGDDTYTITASHSNATHTDVVTYTISGTRVVYPVASIDPQVFEVVETGVDPETPANRVNNIVTLSGTCEAGAAISLLFDNQEQAISCDAGTWNSDVVMVPGKNFVTLTVTDAATLLSTMAYDAIWYLLP